MKFVVEHFSKSSGRLGKLFHDESGRQFKTPLLIQVTKSGSIPYLSREMFNYVSQEAHVIQMSLATMDHMAEALIHFKGSGIADFIGFRDFPTMLTIRDPCERMPSGCNDRDFVPVFTRRGKVNISVQKYISLVETFKPSIYQGISDADTDHESSKKRVQKSVDRTELFMDNFYELVRNSEILKKCCLFVPIVGGYNIFNRSQSIKHAISKGASLSAGYIFEGFHRYGLTASEVKGEDIVPIVTHSLKELGDQKPFLMPGAFTPLAMLQLIQLGIDLFDTSYAYCAAINFKALSFDYNVNANHVAAISESPFIDTTDESLNDDFNPLLKDCSCLTCQKHTRAYIHHLYRTSELLGPILLMIHNLHHLMQFFLKIHKSILDDNLNELIELIEKQGGDKPKEYRIEANTKINKSGAFTG